MTAALCITGGLVVVLSACLAAERLRRVEAERERDGYRRVAEQVVTRLGRFCAGRPSGAPLEGVR